MSAQLKLNVVMDGGDEYPVVADQREWAAYEAADLPAGAVTQIRFFAWAAARRAGRYSGSFDKFNTVDCVSADAATEPEGGDALDPGRKDQAATA